MISTNHLRYNPNRYSSRQVDRVEIAALRLFIDLHYEQEADQRISQGFGVLDREQYSCSGFVVTCEINNCLSEPTYVASDNRVSGCHCFERADPERLGPRRHREGVCCAVGHHVDGTVFREDYPDVIGIE